MDRAETIISAENHVVILPNQAIVDKMQELGFNIDDRIAHNPNFIVNLFTLFGIKDISDIRFNKDSLTIITATPGNTIEQTIVVNSENGLTMTCDIKDDHEGMNFIRLRKIVSLFPTENGFKKVINVEQGIGHIDLLDIVQNTELTIVDVDSKGLEVSSNTIKEESMPKTYIFSYLPSISPLTSNEYEMIMSKQIETKSYSTHNERVRDAQDLTLVHEKINVGGNKVNNDYYYGTEDLYLLPDLSKATETQPTDINALIDNLATKYESFDPAVGRLMINLVNLLNQDVTISIAKPKDYEKQMQREILDSLVNQSKKLSV